MGVAITTGLPLGMPFPWRYLKYSKTQPKTAPASDGAINGCEVEAKFISRDCLRHLTSAQAFATHQTYNKTKKIQ